jgi:predicted acetyltransferase
MTVEIRSIRHDEVEAYGRVVAYVFASEDGLEDELKGTQPEWTTCGFVDGKLVSTFATLPFTVRLNGAAVPMGGVTAVGTLPEQRRRGLLRQIMTQALGTMRDRNQNMAILWASMGAIYQRFGYGLASAQVNYSFDPRYVAFERETAISGHVELVPKDDSFPIMKQNYIEWATPRNLCIHRSTFLWTVNTLRPPKKDALVFTAIYRNADGQSRGHIVYSTADETTPEPGPSQVMTVNDFVALDTEATRALWNYIRRHDLIGRVNMRGAPEDDVVPDLLLEPRMLNRKTSDGIWMRVVDAEKALAQRPYGARGELTLAIAGDTECPWNNGTYLLETDGPTAHITRTDREPELTMSAATLASLISGYRPATHFVKAGRMEQHRDGAALRADALFRTEHAPYCPNGF